MTTAVGIVKWFNPQRGYGFIVFEEKEYFCHFNEILGDGFKTLEDGERVAFEPATRERGLAATNVRREKVSKPPNCS